MLSLDSDADSDEDSGESCDASAKRRRSKAASGDHNSAKDDDSNDDDASLTFEDHIDRILRKTRTIALLKIANNTAEILPEDDVFAYDSDDDFDGDDFDGEGDAFDNALSFETVDRFSDDPPPPSSATKSFRRTGSMRSSASSLSTGSGSGSGHGRSSNKSGHDESAAAMRLVRTLSSFLSLPRVISYKDLEMVASRVCCKRVYVCLRH